MSKDDDKPGVLHSFFGGLMLTIILVVVVPILSVLFVEPIVNEALEDMSFGPIHASMLITAVMLLVFILFILLLGGGKIFKKYGAIGVVGLIAAYWYMESIEDAIIPVAIVILMVTYTYLKDRKKK